MPTHEVVQWLLFWVSVLLPQQFHWQTIDTRLEITKRLMICVTAPLGPEWAKSQPYEENEHVPVLLTKPAPAEILLPCTRACY